MADEHECGEGCSTLSLQVVAAQTLTIKIYDIEHNSTITVTIDGADMKVIEKMGELVTDALAALYEEDPWE